MKALLNSSSVLHSTHVIDGLRHSFAFKIASLTNGTLVGQVTHRQHRKPQDDTGAMYYVVAVIVIYGLSIVLIIASYIRKNKSDRKLTRYLKEMEHLRKREFQMQLINIATRKPSAAASVPGKGDQQAPSGAASEEPKPEKKSLAERRGHYFECLNTKAKVHRYAFSTDNNKMVLEIPAMTYTDSDNDTSIDGEDCSSPGNLHWDSLSRKDSGTSFVSYTESENSHFDFHSSFRRKSSLRGSQHRRVLLVRKTSADPDDPTTYSGEASVPGTPPPHTVLVAKDSPITTPSGTPTHGATGGVTVEQRPQKSVRLVLPKAGLNTSDVAEVHLRISDV